MADRPARLDDETQRAAEEVYDGWYADQRVDWEDFVDRLEAHLGRDLGESMLSPEIKAMKAHVRRYSES